MKLENVTPFKFHDMTLDVFMQDGEPWFAARVVAELLGYSNSLDAVRKHCKGVREMRTPSGGGQQTIKIIHERDVYRLIMRSKLPSAQEFEEWVVAEVLPSVRKTGSYSLPANYAEALRALADSAEETERLRTTVVMQAPAVEFVERYVRAEGLFGIRETAKIIGLTQKEFVALCVSRGVLYREGEGGILQPYAEWLTKGYFEVKTGESHEHAFKQTKFTSKGLEWVRKRLEPAKPLMLAA